MGLYKVTNELYISTQSTVVISQCVGGSKIIDITVSTYTENCLQVCLNTAEPVAISAKYHDITCPDLMKDYRAYELCAVAIHCRDVVPL